MKNTINEMVVVDGSQGEGGGQIFRTTLSLSMCLGKPVKIINIRAGRKKPGLLRQHLTCLKAAQEICDANVVGAELGALEVCFEPGQVKSGEYHFSVGSAGSTTLVFQTLLLPLLFAAGSSEVFLEGGTHNGMSPSYDFIAHCFIPQLEKMGCRLSTTLERVGFYPAGGGSWRVKIHPVTCLQTLRLLDPGEVNHHHAVAMSAKIPGHVAERELDYVKRKLKASGVAVSLRQQLVSSAGPGNILSLRVEMENITEVLESIGERNISAERVAGRVIRDFRRYKESGVAVGEHLADQLLLPMVLGGGGCFRTLDPSQHLLTNIEVIRQLTNRNITLTKIQQDCWQVSVPCVGEDALVTAC